MKTKKRSVQAAAAGLTVLLLAFCSAVQKGADILAATGQISESDRQSLVKTSRALESTFSEITEEQEYYIGRGVAALVLSRYSVYDRADLTHYLNVLGQAVAFASSRPETYAGYHFLVLDTIEINAMSAPGGFVFVSRGLLSRCRNEEMLASVLAHEVAHVCAKHGLQSIKKSRLVDAFRLIGQEAATRYGSQEVAQLTTIFNDSLGDIVSTLIERGYDRKFEYAADEMAVKFTASIGYAPRGLEDFLQTMVGDSSAAAGKGWFKTHPGAQDRLERVRKAVGGLGMTISEEPARTKRFQQTLALLK